MEKGPRLRSRRSLAAGDASLCARPRAGTDTPAVKVVTSASNPMHVWWMGETGSPAGRLCLSACPGKRVEGRDGVKYDRSVVEDVAYLRTSLGISIIVCLLNDPELHSLGLRRAAYEAACQKAGVEMISLPTVEMAPFDSVEVVEAVLHRVREHLDVDKSRKVLMHCRGGRGRAGMLASCFLLDQKVDGITCAGGAIAHARLRRSPQAVECQKQEDFVSKYASHVGLSPSLAGIANGKRSVSLPRPRRQRAASAWPSVGLVRLAAVSPLPVLVEAPRGQLVV